MKNLKFSILAVLTIFLAVSCSPPDEPQPFNEEEVITTVTLSFSRAGVIVATLNARDMDGNGPNMPVFSSTGSLSRSLTYTGATTFTNELKNPAQDITEEVREEDEDHQVFYRAPSALGTFTYADADSNQRPVGLSFIYTPGTATATQNLVVTLRHKLLKSAVGVVSGDITNAGGSTDAEVTFPVTLVP